jgi:hypothetical protein
MKMINHYNQPVTANALRLQENVDAFELKKCQSALQARLDALEIQNAALAISRDETAGELEAINTAIFLNDVEKLILVPAPVKMEMDLR